MKRILFQGDSITDCSRNREDFYSTGGGYPKLVKVALGMEYIGQYECLNRGILGNTIRDLYDRRHEDILNLAPDYLSIYIGVNDVWMDIDYQCGTDTPTFEAIYRKLLEEVESTCPHTKIVLLAPFLLPGSATCREEEPERYPRFLAGVAEKAAAVKAIGKEKALPVIDLQQAFDAACQKAPASYWTWDGVHPGAYGQEIIKRLWLEVFEGIK